MRFIPWVAAGAIGLTVAGCSSPLAAEAAEPDHFRCAATIGAADRMMQTGRARRDPAFQRAALAAATTHLNAWAIPAGLEEREAYARVNRERDRIASGMWPAEVIETAKRCIETV